MNYFFRFACIAVLQTGPLVHGGDVDVQEAVDLFLKTPQFSQFRLSPDGSHVSMIGHENDKNVIRTYDPLKKKNRGLKGISGQNIGSYAWIDKDTLIFSMGLWDVYYIGNYIADQDLRDYEMVGEEKLDQTLGIYYTEAHYSILDPLPQVEGKVLLKDLSRHERFPDVVTYDHLRDKIVQRFRNKQQVTDWECDLSGTIRVIEYLSEPGDYAFAHRWSEDQPWEPLDLPGRTNFRGFDVTGKRLFVVVPDENRRMCFRMYDLEQGQYVGKPVRHPVYSASPRVLKDQETGLLLGAIFNFDKPKVVYYQPTYQNLHKNFQNLFPDDVVRILGLTSVGSILFEVRSDTQPVRIFEFDPKAEKDKITLALHPSPWVKKDHCQPMDPIRFEARDGMEIRGYLTRSRINPDSVGPTVMLVHGGPFRRDSWGFDPEVQFLAYLGYHVIQVNFRGSSGFNIDYSIQRLPRICRKSVRDVADAARWAIDQGIADPERIAIMGGSFGGYAALAGAAFEPDLYKVAIGISGVYNFDRELKSDYRGEGSLKEWLAPMLGDIANDPDVYKDLSPVNFADRIKAKVLLIHGGADSVVHANQSKSMAKALRRADKEVEIDISTWGVHGFYNQKESNRFGSLVGNFLQKHL